MNRTLAFFVLGLFAFAANAQKNSEAVKFDQPYGVIDTADLTMKQCDFEKDAHAEVLFDVRDVDFEGSYTKVFRHVRIKIFDKIGEKYAQIRIPIIKDGLVSDDIRSLKVQTINLIDKTIAFTPVERKYIYEEKTNEFTETLCITLPAITPGSVFEMSYTELFNFIYYTGWFPEEPVPVRYSQISVDKSSGYTPSIKIHAYQPFVNDKQGVPMDGNGRIKSWAFANLHSVRKEQYSGFVEDGLQYMKFARFDPLSPAQIRKGFSDRYKSRTAVLLPTDTMFTSISPVFNKEERVTYVFNAVKKAMKWDGRDDAITHNTLLDVWNRKTGNSTEINLVLYCMLRQAGVRCYPLVVGTRNYSRPDFRDLYMDSFNRMVVYVPIDNKRNYILDATSKFNNYKQTPVDLLDLQGLIIDDEEARPVQVAAMVDNQPAIQSVFIDASINADAKMSGSATITGYGYNKTLTLQEMDTSKNDGYKRRLAGNENSLKISSLKLENMDVDSLPLIQQLNFDFDLGDNSDGYIYFKANLFSSLQSNPFTAETRLSDIYFGYRRFYNITGNYKIPAGFKVEALPKNSLMLMPDSSIIFKRFVGIQDDGSIQIRYSLHFNKSLFLQSDYPALYIFYRKMFETLNEQVVLKKS